MEQTSIEYELIELKWSLEYEVLMEDQMYLREETLDRSIDNYVPEVDGNGIPIGQTMEDIRSRQQIISQFYYQWKISHPEKRIFNESLQDYINVRQVSIEEAKEHASKSYKSTLAFLMLNEVLAKAVRMAEVMPKSGNKNQSKFERLIVMAYAVEGIGTIKLTVGILRSNKNKVQYGISALRDGQPLVDTKKQVSKKKAPHK